MKYAIVIPDGAADEPQPSLGGKTPLQFADTPEMDRIACDGVLGRSRNVPDRFVPASDVATLSLLGYDPERYYTGRAPLEAAAMGIALGPHDWAVRCNLMTINDGMMTDFTAGHITSDEGQPLIEALQSSLRPSHPQVEFHSGVSYRNAMIYHGRPDESPFADDTLTTPPHDVPDQPVARYLPRGTGSALLRDLMRRGTEIVRDHPLNSSRIATGKRPANAIWLWGQGRAPTLPRFVDLYGLTGAMISAVDLVRGVGMLAGWHRIDVPGATGYLATDSAAKGRSMPPRRSSITTSSACTSRHRMRPATKVGPTRRSRLCSGSTRRSWDPSGAPWRLMANGVCSFRPITRHCSAPEPTTAIGRAGRWLGAG